MKSIEQLSETEAETTIFGLLAKLPSHYPIHLYTHNEHGYTITVGHTLLYHGLSANEAVKRTSRYVTARESHPTLPVSVIDRLCD